MWIRWPSAPSSNTACGFATHDGKLILREHELLWEQKRRQGIHWLSWGANMVATKEFTEKPGSPLRKWGNPKKVFGWIKQWRGLRQFKLRGTDKVIAVFCLHVIAYNLIRLGNLLRPAMAAA